MLNPQARVARIVKPTAELLGRVENHQFSAVGRDSGEAHRTDGEVF